MKNATHICEVGRKSSDADKPSCSPVVSNSPVSQRVKKAVAVGSAVIVTTGVTKAVVVGDGSAVNVILIEGTMFRTCIKDGRSAVVTLLR